MSCSSKFVIRTSMFPLSIYLLIFNLRKLSELMWNRTLSFKFLIRKEANAISKLERCIQYDIPWKTRGIYTRQILTIRYLALLRLEQQGRKPFLLMLHLLLIQKMLDTQGSLVLFFMTFVVWSDLVYVILFYLIDFFQLYQILRLFKTKEQAGWYTL